MVPQWLAADSATLALQTILSGNDFLTASGVAAMIRGFDGNDTLAALGIPATIYGGAGDDQIFAGLPPGWTGGSDPTSPTYLRGDAGDDFIQGAFGFNDINGNQGNDTLVGVSKVGDWLVGGQGDDLIYSASDVHDQLFGNLGNDTLHAGSGGDTLRGGQGDDSIVGGAGSDWISGDRGHDTVTGGGGADVFHSAPGAGVTTVTDFSQAQGDRVLLDSASQPQISQAGQDVLVDLGGGTQVILQNTQLASLTSGWLVYG